MSKYDTPQNAEPAPADAGRVPLGGVTFTLRTNFGPTPYQGRVQGVGVHTRMFRNAINNQSIH